MTFQKKLTSGACWHFAFETTKHIIIIIMLIELDRDGTLGNGFNTLQITKIPLVQLTTNCKQI